MSGVLRMPPGRGLDGLSLVAEAAPVPREGPEFTGAGIPRDAEWLEADGLGGFASGTVGGLRTRRYHGILTPAIHPPTARAVRC